MSLECRVQCARRMVAGLLCALAWLLPTKSGFAQSSIGDGTGIDHQPVQFTSSGCLDPATSCCHDPGKPVVNYSFLARGFYLNDQRLEFTGNEATFAAEAQFFFQAQHYLNDWSVGLDAELFLTQPFNRNILADILQGAFPGPVVSE